MVRSALTLFVTCLLISQAFSLTSKSRSTDRVQLNPSARTKTRYTPLPTLNSLFDGLAVKAAVSCVALYAVRRILEIFVQCPIAFKEWLRTVAVWFSSTASMSMRPCIVRQTFTHVPWVERSPAKRHPHPIVAARRSNFTDFAVRFAHAIGRKPYFFQQSPSDQRAHMSGSRTYVWTKDTISRPSFKTPTKNDLIIMVDVDFYVDMPWFLATYHVPILVYTVAPEAVCEPGYEGTSFTFDSDSVMHTLVTGGASYSHRLWNYGTDFLSASRYLFGVIPYSASTYNVDRFTPTGDKHRSVVLLTPVKTWGFLGTLFVDSLETRPLTRLRVAHGQHLRLYVQDQVLKVSHGKVMSYACVTYPASVDDTIACAAQVSKYELSVTQAASYTKLTPEEVVNVVAYHRERAGVKPDVVYPVDLGVRSYTFVNEDVDFDQLSCPMEAFMSPLVHGAFAPTRNKSTDREAVNRRVERVRMTSILTFNISRKMDEFLELVIPAAVANTLVPVEEDQVFDNQDRPSQRRLLEEARAFGSNVWRIIRSFVKAESSAKVADPRLISTIPVGDKLRYARYIYRLSDYVRESAHILWYSFGQSNIVVSERVAQLCTNGMFNGAVTDMNRLDGRMSEVPRELERRCLTRAFHVNYIPEVVELHANSQNQSGLTREKIRYVTGLSRLSGVADTSFFNTLWVAFVDYLSFRNCGYAIAEAWNSLGLYGGDDGLTIDIPDVKAFIRTAWDCGMKKTIDLVQRGQFGIKFLARIYGPTVWFGDNNSCCDLPRQLSKFHTSKKLAGNITARDKLLQKSMSFWLTDKNTPIIGPFVSKVLEFQFNTLDVNATLSAVQTLWMSGHEKYRDLRQWCSTLGDQYPNEQSDWMVDYVVRAMPNFNHSRFQDWLNATEDFYSLMRAPSFQEPCTAVTVSDVPVMVDGHQLPASSVQVSFGYFARFKPYDSSYLRSCGIAKMLQGLIGSDTKSWFLANVNGLFKNQKNVTIVKNHLDSVVDTPYTMQGLTPWFNQFTHYLSQITLPELDSLLKNVGLKRLRKFKQQPGKLVPRRGGRASKPEVKRP